MRNWQVVGITRRLCWMEAEYGCSLGASFPRVFQVNSEVPILAWIL